MFTSWKMASKAMPVNTTVYIKHANLQFKKKNFLNLLFENTPFLAAIPFGKKEMAGVPMPPPLLVTVLKAF